MGDSRPVRPRYRFPTSVTVKCFDVSQYLVFPQPGAVRQGWGEEAGSAQASKGAEEITPEDPTLLPLRQGHISLHLLCPLPIHPNTV